VGTYKECYKGNVNRPPDYAYFVQALTRSTIVALGWSSINSFFFKKLEVFRMDMWGNEHLPSKNHEIIELHKSMSVCSVKW
jgi:hypothetical protein